MSATEDVSWPTVRRIVRDWAGCGAEVAEIRKLHGGTVSNTLCLTLRDGAQAVLKLSAHRVDRSVPREVAQLARLRELGVPVPAVFDWKLASLDAPDSYLLMEFIGGMDLARARHLCPPAAFDGLQRELAELVLKIHSATGASFGRTDGENDSAFENWPTFFRFLYDPLWRELEAHPSTAKCCRKGFNRLHDALPRVLGEGSGPGAVTPRLTHGDLWCSNILAAETSPGQWSIRAIIDPNLRYGHFEAELAYLELFHTVNPAFLQHYKSLRRPDDGYAERRRAVYHMYYLMDHAAFFGGPYHARLAAAVERLGHLV